MNEKLYKIYSLKNYCVNDEFIQNNYEEYELDELIELIEKHDFGYHLRIHPKTDYIFFGDLDSLECDFKIFANDMINFLQTKYNVTVNINEIKYTNNKSKKGSYHYSIPKN